MLKTNLSLKEIRISYELTQIQVSDFVGLSMRHYREKESGNLPFTQMEIIYYSSASFGENWVNVSKYLLVLLLTTRSESPIISK